MNRAFGVAEYENGRGHSDGHGGGRWRRRRRRRSSLRTRAALLLTFAIAFVFGVLTPIAALADHTDPTFPDLPLESPLTDTAKNPGLVLDCAQGSDHSAVGTILGGQASIPPDRDVSGSENRIRPGTVAPEAIWANSTSYPAITTLDVSGSDNVIHGKVVSRSHLTVGGSRNQFQHHTEYGLRNNVSGEQAFNVSGGENCFSGPDADGAALVYDPGEPAQVTRATPPQPDGFPVDFDLDNDGDFADTFAPGSAAALAAQADPAAGNQYHTCLVGSSNIVAPLVCDTSTGKLSGSVQGSQMLTGLYYAAGEVDIAASNLTATVTVVSVGKMKVSGSNESNFVSYTSGLLLLSNLGTPNSVVGDDALDVSGSTSEFEEGHIFAPRGRVTLGGSQNSFQCTVMGDRVTLNGSLLFINGEVCAATAPNVTTEIHAETGGGHTNLGDGASAVEVGTAIHDKVVIASTSDSNLIGTITLQRFATGDCTGTPTTATWTTGAGPPGPAGGTYAPATTVTIDPALAFTPAVGIYSYRATYGGDPDNPGPVVGKCEGPVRVVDARITITPGTDANEAGSPHLLTGHVDINDGSGWANAPAGTVINFAVLTGTGTLTAPSCMTILATGSCTVTLNNSNAGTDTVSASTTVSIAGVSLSRSTNGNAGPGGSGNATKTWVKVRISITPLTDANEAGSNHDLTITLEKSVVEDTWTPLADENVTASITNSNGATAVFVPAGDNACTTGALGTCIVTISSPTAGTTVVEANWAGGTVEGAAVTAKTSQPDASKTWVKVRISITPLTDANEAGSNHDLTITLEKSVVEDTWTPLADENVTASITNSNGATAVFVPAGDNACTTGALGTCIVTISSPTAGTTVVEANWAGGTVEGAAVTAKTSQPDASKTWVKVRISITPLTDANEAGSNHDLTITLEQSVVEDTWTPLADENVTASITNSNGATAVFVPAGDNACTTGALGTCIVTISSPTAGTTVVEANWAGGTVEGAAVTAKTSQPDASKTWVKVRISITPLTDANEAGSNHDLTITLEKSVVEDTWTPLADENVTASITNSNGATAVFVPAGDNACTTGALGTCIVTISSPTAGTTVVEANWAGGTVEGAAVTAKTSQPDASKTWVKVRISITPLTDANEAGSNHDLTITLEQSVVEDTWTPLADENVTASITNSNGATAVFVPAGDNACTTGALGTCIVTISSPTAGTTVVEANWAGGTVEGAAVTAKTSQPDASKTWVKVRISITPLNDTNPIGSNHDLTITLEKSVVEGTWTPLAGETVSASLTNSNGATATFVPAGDNTCDTGALGTCIVTISSPTAGTTVVEATWNGGTVEGASITAKVTQPDATKLWIAEGATLLIIDEDSIDNGIHVNKTGVNSGRITPSGPQFFSDTEVNDQIAKYGQRTPLAYFNDQANIGDQITLKTGQTGDEGWFAPTCIPQKWVSGTSNTCLDDPARQTGIDNYFGASNVSTLAQSKLDKIPAVMPLRALGLKSLEGKDICAVVYDSDISINYDKTIFPFTSGNLQGATLGIVAFRVDLVRTLPSFSSSTLPQVTITINDPKTCNPTELFNAPVPRSSSVPNDINGETPINHTGSSGYRQLKTYLLKDLFF